MKQALVHAVYRSIIKPVCFQFEAERVHEFFLRFGECLGKHPLMRSLAASFCAYKDVSLEQTLHKIPFSNPVGLAAGFDYKASLTEILSALGFGFQTVGTITNGAYEGNEPPRLDRLKRSRSLLVNKGFKNPGIDVILQKLATKKFFAPVGLSIGMTNGRFFGSVSEAIEDIALAFQKAVHSPVPFSFFELNVSCPNLLSPVDFYEPAHLSELLTRILSGGLQKPLFIKMPISESDHQTRLMLDVIVRFPVAGIIFGNLQKNRQDPALVPEEVTQAGKGHFSGKPTEQRSNELIALAYREYGHRLTIIGCGGIFSAEDAYKKISAGASLVQLITGMVYEGPQLIGEINSGLVRLLKRDGFVSIREAIGKDSCLPKK